MTISEFILATVAVVLSICLYLHRRERTREPEEDSQTGRGFDVNPILPRVQQVRQDYVANSARPSRNDFRQRERIAWLKKKWKRIAYLSRPTQIRDGDIKSDEQ